MFPKVSIFSGHEKNIHTHTHTHTHTGLWIHSLKERRKQALCKHEIVLPSLGKTTTPWYQWPYKEFVSCLHPPTCTSPTVATNMGHSWNSHLPLVWYKPYPLFPIPQLWLARIPSNLPTHLTHTCGTCPYYDHVIALSQDVHPLPAVQSELYT